MNVNSVGKAMTPSNVSKAANKKLHSNDLESHSQVVVEDSKEKFKKQDVNLVKAKSSQDLTIASEIRRLKMWEEHVKQHEQQHQLAGGEFAGAPSYTYTRGPDGKRYISGGEVTMYVPAGVELEDSEAALEKVKRAASAPSDPSPQDLKTAAMASAKQASVRSALIKKQAKEAYEASRQQENQIKELRGESVNAISKFQFNHMNGFELFV